MIYTFDLLDKKLKNGETSQCISVNGARIIIPTQCSEVVGFTNPDDLEPALLTRWKNGERGPEFENQKLQPGDALVMYNNGRDMNKILEEIPNWQTSASDIKTVINKLYSCAEVGGKLDEPAIWNTDYSWAESVSLTTTSGKKVTQDMWGSMSGTAMEVIKSPIVQDFITLNPGDKLLTSDGRAQTAGAMSAIAIRQPDGGWNIVQLNAKGYKVVKENVKERTNPLDRLRERKMQIKNALFLKKREIAIRS